jgi:FAD/FMN-containing dehydrogenase
MNLSNTKATSSAMSPQRNMIKKAFVPLQLFVGSIVLGIILITLPFLYLALFVKYKWYVNQRERVIRGMQRKDKSPLEDVKVLKESIQRGSISERFSQQKKDEDPLSINRGSIRRSSISERILRGLHLQRMDKDPLDDVETEHQSAVRDSIRRSSISQRVFRGMQRMDEYPLEDLKVPCQRMSSGDISENKSMCITSFTESALPSTNSMDIDEIDLDITERVLSNYSGTYKIACDVTKIKEEKDIVEVIKVASKKGMCVRAMGSLFSWPNIVEPGSISDEDDPKQEKRGVVLDMKPYNKMLEALILPEEKLQSDGTAALVTVQSGMKVWQLCELLDRLGYALPVLGNVTGQSVGGVISTGTHGKNLRFGTMSSLVQSMRLVLASGAVKNIALRDHKGEYSQDPLSRAAGVSLGLLGVISTVTLRVVPKHRLAFSISSMSFEKFINSYEEIVKNAEHVAFIYFPFVDMVRVETSEKLREVEETTLKDRAMPRHSRFKLFFAQILNYVLFESVFGKWFTPIIWLIIRYITLIDGSGGASIQKPAIDKSYNVVALNVNFDIEHHEMEYAYDMNDATRVIKAYRNVLQNLPSNYQYSSMLDIRFSAGDSAWLAASSDRPTVWLDLIRPDIHKNTEFFMSEFKPIVIKYLGRPHLGKENILIKSELEQCFPNFAEFVKFRDELDPDRVFANKYFDSLLG